MLSGRIVYLNFEIEDKDVWVLLGHEAMGHLSPPLYIYALVVLLQIAS